MARAVALYHKAITVLGAGFRTRGYVPSYSSLAGVTDGFHPTAAAVLCLR